MIDRKAVHSDDRLVAKPACDFESFLSFHCRYKEVEIVLSAMARIAYKIRTVGEAF
jgi:hypothetical protein